MSAIFIETYCKPPCYQLVFGSRVHQISLFFEKLILDNPINDTNIEGKDNIRSEDCGA